MADARARAWLLIGLSEPVGLLVCVARAVNPLFLFEKSLLFLYLGLE